jgi:hypothetical protein
VSPVRVATPAVPQVTWHVAAGQWVTVQPLGGHVTSHLAPLAQSTLHAVEPAHCTSQCDVDAAHVIEHIEPAKQFKLQSPAPAHA